MSDFQYDPKQAGDLLKALGYDLDHFDGLELRFIKEGNCQQLWPQSWDTAWAKISKANSEGMNIYFGVCPRQGQKGNKGHVISANAVWADLDGKNFNPSDSLKGKNLALKYLGRSLPSEFQASILVDSGNGFHLYWLLKESWSFNGGTSRQGFELILRGLASSLNGDKGVAEISRVMRLPGTYNVKNPARPLACRILECDPSKRFNPSDFEDYVLAQIKDTNPEYGSVGVLGEKRPPSYTTLKFLSLGCPEGERNNRAFEAAADLCGCGYSEEEALSKILEACRICDLPEQEGRNAVKSAYSCPRTPSRRIATSQPEESNAEEDVLNSISTTDAGQGEAIALMYGNRLRFDHTSKRWFIWDGVRWKEDKEDEIVRIAVRVAQDRLSASGKCVDGEKRKSLAKWAIRSEGAYQIECALKLASSQRQIAATSDRFNNDPMLIACANGVIDLRSGELRDGRPQDLMTYSAGVSYERGEPCPRWLRFLEEVFNGDRDLITFVQKAVGYSLTGRTDEQALFICYGTGANGKTVFLNTLLNILGEYGANTPFSTILTAFSGPRTASNDVAALRERRLVTASEVNEGLRFDEGRVKSLTGGDPITARFLYQENFTFSPKFKLWLAVNHRPTVSDTTESLWRRIRLLPFTNYFPPDRADPGLGDELKNEAPGILAWAVEGVLKWQREGLGNPEAVKRWTQEYRTDNDLIGKFLEERVDENPRREAEVLSSALYREFTNWSDQNGEAHISSTLFGRKISERGILKIKKSGRIVYQGISLKNPGQEG